MQSVLISEPEDSVNEGQLRYVSGRCLLSAPTKGGLLKGPKRQMWRFPLRTNRSSWSKDPAIHRTNGADFFQQLGDYVWNSFFFQNVFHLSVSLVWWFSRVKSLRNSDGKTHSRLEFGATLDATFELWSTAEYSVHTRTEIRSLQDEIHSVHILQNVERHAWLGSVYTGFRSCNTFL